ncbi:MAG: substrate-binding domain-containing protein, partial [Acidimicrobiia bacterium]
MTITPRQSFLAIFAFVLAACTSGDPITTDGTGVVVPGGCEEVPIATSPEKFTLFTSLAETFNATGTEFDGECAVITVYRASSGAAARMLAEGWPEDGSAGPLPVIWSPAASTWGAIVNERLAARGEEPIANDFERVMITPLVLGMPRPMAEALGWPEADIGWADILQLAADPEGWGALGHPEWGDFRLGKTNPNFSTSGLAATAATYYAATGKTVGLTEADLDDPEVLEFVRGVEAATVHYGDTTLTFLDNMYRADQEGRGLTYASAVAVEEVSIIAYNRGDPADTGTPGPAPRVPLVAIYPEEGTLYSDNPAYILDAPWVSDVARQAATAFRSFVIDDPENQQQ